LSLSKRIFNISNEDEFNSIALEVFEFQYKNIPVYKKYVDLIKSQSKSINHFKEIPFLPIDFFKYNKIIADNSKIEKTFLSSGTSNTIRSKHFVKDLELYERSFNAGFKYFYSDPKEWTILALLPSYLDQGDSSLIYMVNKFINKSQNPESNYINYDLNVLKNLILKLKDKNVLLIGVSYALLELSELDSFNLENWVVMETGGMKGRRKEMVRQELHQQLKKAFNVDAIHSEYGMTELLSQAYSKKNGLFETPPWMKFIIRDFEDPYSLAKINSSGGINIIDLANIYSCSFIETQDIGKEVEKDSFEILGRFDQSEVRGCNLLSF
jgi:phenylacetate-coenzyme A ligase PaaK-like adenylate-forming protein